MIKRDPNVEVYASGQYIRMSADKARRVLDQIRGLYYEQTLMMLELMPYRACYPIFKLVYSAAANASHNMAFNKEDLIISQAEVNGGTLLKRFKPRARGRSYPVKKPTCHITIVLQDISKDQDFFIWLRKRGWIYETLKKINMKEKYVTMSYEKRMIWTNGGGEVVWDEVVWDKK